MNAEFCTIVRIKTAGQNGFTLSGAHQLRIGSRRLHQEKDPTVRMQLMRQLSFWKDTSIALSVEPESVHCLPATIPFSQSSLSYREYCQLEAEHFLMQPEHFACDSIIRSRQEEASKEELLLFYPDSGITALRELRHPEQELLYSGTIVSPLIFLSTFSEEPQAIMMIEPKSLLLLVCRKGKLKTFACHQISSRDECEYFAMKTITESPLCRKTVLQLTGNALTPPFTKLLQTEKWLRTQPLKLPSALRLAAGKRHLLFPSSAMVSAISTALMALENKV